MQLCPSERVMERDDGLFINAEVLKCSLFPVRGQPGLLQYNCHPMRQLAARAEQEDQICGTLQLVVG